jgi:hypothetical protein
MSQIEKFVADEKPPTEWSPIRSSFNSRVWKLFDGSQWCIVKEYNKRGPLEYPKAALVGSRAKKAWKEGLNLLRKGFLTPGIQVLGEKIHFGIPTRNFLVTAFISDAKGIYTLLKEDFNNPLTLEGIKLKRIIVSALGKAVGRLHAERIVHGDLRLDNIIVSGLETAEPKLYFIDNERNKYFPKGIPSRLREKNLIQVNMVVVPQVTFTDRLRFFNAYLKENPELAPHKKNWIKKVFLKTKKRLDKNSPGLWTQY